MTVSNYTLITYKSISKSTNQNNLTGANAATQILKLSGINDINIEIVDGKFLASYNRNTNTLKLSNDVYNGTSIVSVGIACHEAGHIMQYSKDYIPIFIKDTASLVSKYCLFAGLIMSVIGAYMSFNLLINISLIALTFSILFHFIVLPLEFNANSRVVKIINESNLISNDDIPNVKKVLKIAAISFIADLSDSLFSVADKIAKRKTKK